MVSTSWPASIIHALCAADQPGLVCLLNLLGGILSRAEDKRALTMDSRWESIRTGLSLNSSIEGKCKDESYTSTGAVYVSLISSLDSCSSWASDVTGIQAG